MNPRTLHMRRKTWSMADKVKILMRQAVCPLCRGRLTQPCEIDHIHELALGGEDEPENAQFVCYACHQSKTNGNGATTAGSSKARVAKVRRLNRAQEEFRKALLAKGAPTAFLPIDHADRAKRSMWRTGRKIPSRPMRSTKHAD